MLRKMIFVQLEGHAPSWSMKIGRDGARPPNKTFCTTWRAMLGHGR